MLPPVPSITITSGLYYANVFNYAADLTEEFVNAVNHLCHRHTLLVLPLCRGLLKNLNILLQLVYYRLTLNQPLIPNLMSHEPRMNELMFKVHLLVNSLILHDISNVCMVWSTPMFLWNQAFWHRFHHCLNQLTTNYLLDFGPCCYSWLKPLIFHSGDDSDVDSEVEDRVDGVKSWLSKNKGSTKTLSDDGNMKAPRSVWITFFPGLKCPCQAPCLRSRLGFVFPAALQRGMGLFHFIIASLKVYCTRGLVLMGHASG